MPTKKELKMCYEILDKIYQKRIADLKKLYPRENFDELSAEVLWEYDEHDRLLESIDNIQATLEEHKFEI